ncbi:MAG: sigma-70 family RNA polymerase sigma factor [Anaerolineales bacterium]|nr:sigma-70 family RNA polymerase sigma factor [Anaerolineales bacterium]
MTDLTDDDILVQQIRAGDTAAWTLFVNQYGAPIYRLALRLMKNEADAEDVVQETFINALNGIDTFEARSKLSTWLYRIAYNNALMRLRVKEPLFLSVESTLAEDGVGPPTPKQLFDWCCLPERDLRTAEVRHELEAAIQALPVTLRPVFVLRELEGLSTQETAEALDLSTAVVKKRLQRARHWLRERLSDFFVEKEEVLDDRAYLS